MKFWDREKELTDLKRYLQTEPNAILFVYGPKSSGKSTLLMRVAREMREKPVRFLWYDLRGYAVERMEDAIAIILGGKGISDALLRIFDINLFVVSIKTEELLRVLRREKDPFVVLERELVRGKEDGITPVVVFDELQNLKDIYLNGERRLVDRLFNFFVRLTKVLHLAHVFVMTSDTFFIEEVYTSSALKNTSEYYLVDYFDDETTLRILMDEGLSEEDARYVVEHIGGVPWMIERILSNGDVREKIEVLYKQHRARLMGFLMEYPDEEKAKEVLKALVERDFKLSRDNIRVVKDLAKAEVLFYDPVDGSVRFQTKLDEKAAREILNA